jgi:hypothetical protein
VMWPSHWRRADGLVKCVHMPSPLLCYLTPDFSLVDGGDSCSLLYHMPSPLLCYLTPDFSLVDGDDSCSLLYIINSASTPSSIFWIRITMVH